MEAGEWTHPDISLPQLLSLVRAFAEMLLLASGYQPSASAAYWRTHDVQRALGWASLLEQIIAKISVHDKDKGSRETLNRALQDFMLETLYPEALPKLSCEILGEAKRILIHAISHALGSGNGQIESLVAAAYRDEQDWEVVFQHIRNRFRVVESTKSATKALELASMLTTRHVQLFPALLLCSSNNMCSCQQWRQEALSYLTDGRTLYKLSGATVLFKCNEIRWKAALRNLKAQAEVSKSAEIAELCCLHKSQHRHSVLIARLTQPCDRMSCSNEALRIWDSADHSMERVVSKETDAVEAFVYELAESEKGIWWSLPPILVAAALMKGSLLFEHYNAQLSRHKDSGDDASSSYRERGRCAGGVLETQARQKYGLDARRWCLRFVKDSAVEDDALKQDTQGERHRGFSV